MIPVDAHIRLAAPAENRGVRLLRRGFSFTDGIDPVTNQLDAGLFFIAYQRDPRTGFIPVQQNLAPTRSTSTSATTPPPRSPARRASAPAASWARRCFPERSVNRGLTLGIRRPRDRSRRPAGPIPIPLPARAPLHRRGQGRPPRAALKAAMRLGHNYIGTEHLLLGAVAADDEVAERLAGSGSTPSSSTAPLWSRELRLDANAAKSRSA